MRIRILQVPSRRALQDMHLRPYAFQKDRVYNVDAVLAEVLCLRRYAERVSRHRDEVTCEEASARTIG